jgi:Tubulin like
MAEEQRNIVDDGTAANVRKVAPTILIGLGGTGKEVLLRLRRRFYERYNFFGFPTMAYLWVDTDTRNVNIDGQVLDHIMDAVKFRQEERVSAEIPGDAFMEYFRNQTRNPHIFSWLDQKLSAQGQVLNGAGQVRPLGRLAFFHSFDDVSSKLNKALAKVQDKSAKEEMLNRYGIDVDVTALDVILIFSVAGGTGSGMFLDMAFLCRQVLPKPNITGYLMLPSVFADSIKDSEKIFANGYAALKELEYYSWRKDIDPDGRQSRAGNTSGVSRHDYAADWKNAGFETDHKPAPITAPAFSTCYLIDNMTQGGGVIRPKDKQYLCDMIAENIFLNFSAESFARMKDSVRSNLETPLTQPLHYRYDGFGSQGGYTELLSQRFSTMGFSKLFVPVDRIRRACGYQLALDMISRWLKPNDLSEIELQKQLEARELEKLGLRGGGASDDFVGPLRRAGQTTFDDEIRAAVNQWRVSLLQQVNTEKKPAIYTTIPKLLKDFVKLNFERSDVQRPETWGTYMISLEQNRERLVRDLCGEFDPTGKRKTGADGRILGRVKDWLKDDRVRLDQAVELLKVAGKLLDRHVEELYTKAKQAADRKASTSLDDIKIKLEMVRDEENSFLVQRKSLRVLTELLCDSIRDHLIARMNGFILGAAIEAIQKSVKPYIGTEVIRQDSQGKEVVDRAGLILELWRLREELARVHTDLRARFDSFEQVEEHLIYENMYQRGMFRNYYTYKPTQDGMAYPVEQKLDELESLFFQQIEKTNPYDLRDLLKDPGREWVLEQMEDFGYKRFQQLEVNADVLELFKQTYQKPEERRQRLQRFVNNGSVWLPMSTKASNQLKANRADSALISQASGMQNKYKEIYETISGLVQSADFKQLQYPMTNRADAIFLYTEYAGIPLAYTRNLDRYYEEAYLPLLRRGLPLHTDANDAKFTDILVKSSEEIERTLRANRALLVGTILRTVAAAPVNGDVTFSFRSFRDGVPNVRPLGGKAIAIETLKRDDSLLSTIEAENVRRRTQLKPEARQRFYTLLAYHILTPDEGNKYGFEAGPYAPTYRITGGMGEYLTPEYKVIEEVRNQEYRQIMTELGNDDAKVQEVFQRLYNTKDDFSQEVVIDNRRMRILKDGK